MPSRHLNAAFNTIPQPPPPLLGRVKVVGFWIAVLRAQPKTKLCNIIPLQTCRSFAVTNGLRIPDVRLCGFDAALIKVNANFINYSYNRGQAEKVGKFIISGGVLCRIH